MLFIERPAATAAGCEVDPRDRPRDQTEYGLRRTSTDLDSFFEIWGRGAGWAPAVEGEEGDTEVEEDRWEEG